MFLYQHSSFGAPPPPWFKGKTSPRPATSVTAICAHQTAVLGGFGADSLEDRCDRYAGTSEAKPGSPYHYVYSPQDHALCAIWHPDLYSYHGNGANAYSIGLAVDGKYPGDVVDEAELAEALRLAIVHARSVGFHPTELEAHRQHSDQRGGDPGAEIWPVLEITALSMGISPTITRTTGTGRAIPDSWRPETVPDPGPGTGVELPTIDAAACSREDLRTVQGLLEARHHDPRGIDGLWGRNTSASLEAFKSERGLQPGSIVDGPVWSALLAAG